MAMNMAMVTATFPNTEISKKLGITKNTVKAHMSKIMEKLAVTDRVQAAVKATKQNLLQ